MFTKHTLILFFATLITTAVQAQPSEEHIFDSDGYTIHYRQSGSGSPVILIHGFMTDTDQNWELLMPELSRHFTAIGMDIRAHGESEDSYNPDHYGEELVLDVVRLIDHLKVESAHVVGYSLGGFIAMKLATEYPERVASVVAAGSGFHTPQELETVGTMYATGLRRVENASDLLTQRYSKNELSDEFLKQIESNDKEALAHLIQTIDVLGITKEEAQELKVPVLAIAGENDPNLPKARQLEDIVPHAQVVEIAGHHHLNTPLSPKFVNAIRDFLIRVEETASVN